MSSPNMSNPNMSSPICSCQSLMFTEVLLEDKEQPAEYYHISAAGEYVIAAGKDNFLRVWSRDLDQNGLTMLFRLSTPPDILTIAISSSPLRIFIATKNEVQVYKIQAGAQPCTTLRIKNVFKIRVQESLIILCTNNIVIGLEFQNNEAAWCPKFGFGGKNINIVDAILVRQSKFIVLSKMDQHLAWQIYDYLEIENQVQLFTAGFSWSAGESVNVLDTSSEGLCYISSDESDVYILDLMKEGDDPASGWAGNGVENNYGGHGCFLRQCGIDGHQAPFLFCGIKKAEFAIAQKLPNQTDESDGYRTERYKDIAIWQGEEDDNVENPVFPILCHYSRGLVFVWNSRQTNSRKRISAVLLLDYAKLEGSCRLYEASAYNRGDKQGYYVMSRKTRRNLVEGYHGIGPFVTCR